MDHITKNQARCLGHCDIMESEYIHHNKTCSCGNLSVDDGGTFIGDFLATQKIKERQIFYRCQQGKNQV